VIWKVQCVVECCRVLQCVAVCCSVVQCGASWYRVYRDWFHTVRCIYMHGIPFTQLIFNVNALYDMTHSHTTPYIWIYIYIYIYMYIFIYMLTWLIHLTPIQCECPMWHDSFTRPHIYENIYVYIYIYTYIHIYICIYILTWLIHTTRMHTLCDMTHSHGPYSMWMLYVTWLIHMYEPCDITYVYRATHATHTATHCNTLQHTTGSVWHNSFI